jgi:hypothetical protein
MPKVSIGSAEKAPIVAAPEGARGQIETRAIFDRDVDPIHLHLHRLEPDATAKIIGSPTDRLVFVLEGAVDAGGVRLGPKSTAIVEYGSALTVTGLEPRSVLLVFGRKERRPEEGAGGHVHLLPTERVPRKHMQNEGHPVELALYADAQCPTCRLWLHEADVFKPNEVTAPHYHTEDEVIFVTSGSMRLGNRLYGPGTALAVAANTIYGFSNGPEGLGFINFRGNASTTVFPGSERVSDDVNMWHSIAGIPDFLDLPTDRGAA